jgi:hypothetical protein
MISLFILYHIRCKVSLIISSLRSIDVFALVTLTLFVILTSVDIVLYGSGLKEMIAARGMKSRLKIV